MTFKSKILPILVATVPIGCIPTATPAEQVACASREVIIKRLTDKYGEIPRGMGIRSGMDSIVEIFANPVTGTWTIFVTVPNGNSCLVETGQGWVDASPLGKPS